MNKLTTFNLGKAVKKLKMQNVSIEKIAEIVDKTPEECINAYKKYMGFTYTPIHKDLKKLILEKEKIHLYGSSGTGKSYAIKNLARELNLTPFFSYATNEEELVKDWGDGVFIEADNIFILEGDSFRWKKYGVIKRYIENAKTPIVIITNGKDTPTKNITKLLTQVKMFPPTRSEVATWIKSIDDDYEHIPIDEIYDKDWRKVVRNYNTRMKHKSFDYEKEYLEAKNIVYKLLKGNCTIEDIDNCVHPISFIINWIGWNMRNFYEGDSLKYMYNIVSFLDSVKYSTSQDFLKHILLQCLPSSEKQRLRFPPYKRYKKKKEEEAPIYIVEKFKTKKQKPKKEEKSLSDFLLI